MKYTPRASWGGRDGAGYPMAGAKLLVIAHHAYLPNVLCGVGRKAEEKYMRGMDTDHAGKGWGGLGYQWAVFQSGNRYEGRGWQRTGAHTVGRNSSSIGILLVIDGSLQAPSPAALESFRETVAEGVQLGHIAPQHRIAPHDEFQPKVCPGPLVKTSGLLGGSVPPVHHEGAVAPLPTLRKGKGGTGAPADVYEAVRQLQRLLGMADHHRTGYFGDLTDAAVRAFQRERNLLVDGIVGPKTWAALVA